MSNGTSSFDLIKVYRYEGDKLVKSRALPPIIGNRDGIVFLTLMYGAKDIVKPKDSPEVDEGLSKMMESLANAQENLILDSFSFDERGFLKAGEKESYSNKNDEKVIIWE